MTNTIEKVHNKNRPMPEMFTRDDIRNTGGWDVRNVKAVRGEPYITVSGRVMRVPLDDSLLARAIRAHEQIHVKVSPQDITPYITEVTGEGAIRAAEEARVNMIASMLGFPMGSLQTGSEKFDGELIAQNDAWDEAVYAVAAAIHTGSLKPLISGVRRFNDAWADSLREIAKELVAFQKEQIKQIKSHIDGVRKTTDTSALEVYGSTSKTANNHIKGMNYTIELAMLLESIASMPSPQQETNPKSSDGEPGSNGTEKPDKLSEDTEDNDLTDNKQTVDREMIQNKAKAILKNNIGVFGVGEWLPLNVKRMPMGVTIPGAIGRKRVASNIGRNPRRMHRILTDPDKRVFDKFVKSTGGVVLIDCSGSMRLSKEDVRNMMMAAPGCVVLGYSASWQTEKPNLFILGEKGKICNELPKFPGGNGNDLPAIKFAVSKRQNAKTPVIWITDGMVYRPSGGGGEYDERECAEYARKHRVHMEYSPENAIKYLNNLKKGHAHKPQILQRWKEHLKQVA